MIYLSSLLRYENLNEFPLCESMKSTPSLLWAMKTANDKWCLENNLTSEWIRAHLFFAKPEMFAPVRKKQELKRESKDFVKPTERIPTVWRRAKKSELLVCFHLHQVYAQRIFCLRRAAHKRSEVEVKLRSLWMGFDKAKISVLFI